MPRNPTQANPTPIDFILILRGILALGVVIFHSHILVFGEVKPLYPLSIPWYGVPDGRFAVWCFFVLSGYLMGKGFYSGRYNCTLERIIALFKNRFLRIVPLYTVVCIASFLLHRLWFNRAEMKAHWVQLMTSLVTFTYNCATQPYDFNGPLWSISTEVQFYFWMPFWFLGLRWLMARFKQQAWGWAVFSLFLVLGTLLGYGIFTQEVTPFYRQANNPEVARSFSALIYVPLIANFWLFLGGMILNWLASSILNYQHRRSLLWVIGGLTLAGFLGSSYLYRYGFVSFEFKLFRLYAILMPLLSFPVVLLPILLNELKIQLPFKGVLSGLKPFLNTLQCFGHLSYGIYLWHFPLIVACQKLLPMSSYSQLSVGSYWVLLSSVSLSLTLVVSAITYRYIEQPIECLKKKLLANNLAVSP